VLGDKLHRCCFGRWFQSPNFDAEVLGEHENGAAAGQNAIQKSKRRGHEKLWKGSVIDTEARL
jgi:hypothetical protein